MTIRLEYGIPSEQSGLAVRFGIAKGFFANAGIDLAMRTVYGGPELAAALGSGEIKIGELGSPPGITAIGRGTRLKIVASSVERGLGFFLLVDPLIKSWADLKGTTAGGLSRGSCGYWYLQQILAQHGIELEKEVAFSELGADYDRQVEMLRSRKINLILSTEPYCTLAENLGIAKLWGSVGDLGELPKIQWMVVVANESFLSEQPDDVRALLRAARQASAYAIGHLEEYIDFSAAHFGIERDVVRRAFHRELPYHHFGGELDLPGLQRAIDLQYRLGAISRVLPLNEVADTRILSSLALEAEPVFLDIAQSSESVMPDNPAISPRPHLNESFLDMASELSRELAATAAQRDREGKPPFAEIDLLRRSGLLKLLAPRAVGGGSGQWTDAMSVTRAVAEADGSIGQLIGYHYVNCVIAELQATPDQLARFWADLVRGNWFVGDSLNPLDPALIVKRNGNEVRLTGRKSFSTGALLADRNLIAFFVGNRPYLALIPADRKGFHANDDWDNMGQRLSASGSVSFDNVKVKSEEILGAGLDDLSAPTPRATLYVPVVHSALAHVLLGISKGAVGAAAEYTRKVSRPWLTSGVEAAIRDPYVLEQFGHLISELSASLALGEQAGEELEQALGRGQALTAQERGTAAVATYRSKVHSTKTALETTAKIFELMGARSTAGKYAFDRYWRNVRTLTLHDPVCYKAREVGDHFLNSRIPDVTFYS
jgi:alkylation response protein AidB-like acyl-CoA dehydrogenase/ABC-type nitrate/sulfonate/bicarbonate transport system substrate-binding protein